MDATLLITKLHIPAPCPALVDRPRLVQILSKALSRSLTLVSAPAGYGKTTLVSAWLNEVGVPSTWLSLDEGDNDPIRFLGYFINALQKIIPDIQLELLGVLSEMGPAPFDALLNLIINDIDGHAAPFILVLDDFHVIHAKPVLEIVNYLLDHLPPHMHLLLISRTDPPLPLSRLRARGQLVDVRAGQLRFTRDEVSAFLNDLMGLELSEEIIEALEARTEGWIAGLQLASIALQAMLGQQSYTSMQAWPDLDNFVATFSGSHYYIMDYLADEVLSLQTETVRNFLLQSSILEALCGQLCDEVLDPNQAGTIKGQEMLEALEQMNMFIIPLDSQRRWYRYHHLFADVLNRRLEGDYPHLIPGLHHRASKWYEQNGFIFDAIRHSLSAGDQDRAARLLDAHGCLLLMRGEVINLLHWIEAVEPYSQILPWIAIQKAWALCLTGQLDQAVAPLQTAWRLVSALEPTDDSRTMSGAILAAQAYQANMREETRLAANLARQALDCLPASSDLSCSLRSAATSILGDASWMDGDLAGARSAYVDAVSIGQATGNIYMVIIANSNLADTLMEMGKLRQAARIYSETLQVAMLPDGKISPLAESVYAGLSRISYEWNHLEEAEKYSQQSLALSNCWGSFSTQASSFVMLAGLEYARGRFEKSQEYMRLAEQLMDQHPLSPWRSNSLKSELARLWIALGNLDKAAGLVQSNGILVDPLPQEGDISPQLEPLYLILVNLHLAQGEYDVALELSQRLLQKFDEANRLGYVVKVLVLQALAFQRMGEIDQALGVLKKAFSLARPEGYIRTFLDEGESMLKLLYQAKSRQIGAGYAAELLSAMGEAYDRRLPPAELLIKPLTLRELEILKLIESGCSNQEIAARLVISMPTVKRHISNIYTKLEVASRTQAISRSKELNLFQ